MARLFYGWVVGGGALGFLGVQGLGALFTTAFVFGYSYGAVSTLFTAMVGDFFGRAHAGTMVGVLFALAGSMAGWGPIAGAIHDATSSYAPAFLLAAALNVLAIGSSCSASRRAWLIPSSAAGVQKVLLSAPGEPQEPSRQVLHRRRRRDRVFEELRADDPGHGGGGDPQGAGRCRASGGRR